jgi:hypothetical protein
MSVTTGSNNPKTDSWLKVSLSAITQGIGEADELETLRLIYEITRREGLLDDRLLDQLRQHPFFGSLHPSDWERIAIAQTGRYTGNLKWLLRKSLNVISVNQRVKPLPADKGWRGMAARASQLIAKLTKQANAVSAVNSAEPAAESAVDKGEPCYTALGNGTLQKPKERQTREGAQSDPDGYPRPRGRSRQS